MVIHHDRAEDAVHLMDDTLIDADGPRAVVRPRRGGTDGWTDAAADSARRRWADFVPQPAEWVTRADDRPALAHGHGAVGGAARL